MTPSPETPPSGSSPDETENEQPDKTPDTSQSRKPDTPDHEEFNGGKEEGVTADDANSGQVIENFGDSAPDDLIERIEKIRNQKPEADTKQSADEADEDDKPS